MDNLLRLYVQNMPPFDPNNFFAPDPIRKVAGIIQGFLTSLDIPKDKIDLFPIFADIFPSDSNEYAVLKDVVAKNMYSSQMAVSDSNWVFVSLVKFFRSSGGKKRSSKKTSKASKA